MVRRIPYQRPPRGPLREISDNLQNGWLPSRNADPLLAAGVEWGLVAPHIQDLTWWKTQKPHLADPPELDWRVEVWGTTIRLATADAIIWVDPGTQAPVPHEDPELVIVTHAHFDHTARLDWWARDYPSMRIVMTTLTADLLELRANIDPELKVCLERAIRIDFDQPRIVNGVHLRFLPAGHLLGAAMVEIGYGPDKVLVTGDFAMREVGGLPGATIPAESYGIVMLGVSGSGAGSLPFADLETSRRPFLEKVSDQLDQGCRPLLIPVQPFGQAQEAYAAFVMAQRAGAFSDVNVSLKDLAASVSALYARELSRTPGPWTIPYDSVGDAIPENSVVILSDQDRLVKGGNYVLHKPAIHTHAGWGEQLAFAMGISCAQMYYYHGFNISLDIALRNLDRKVCAPQLEV